MGEIYKRIESLCAEKKINITVMCREANIPRSALTDYKAGRIKTLSTDKLQKIAEYFSVSVDYLLGNTNTKKAPVNPALEGNIAKDLIEKGYGKTAMIIGKGSDGADTIPLSDEEFEAMKTMLEAMRKIQKSNMEK